jgi:hypothetical protein
MHFSPLAYLDPGSGSFLIQLIFATIAGLGIVAIASWNKIKGWFGIKSKPKSDEDDEDEAE